MTQSEQGLSPEQAEWFARGLFHLANIDGLDPREADLLREFIRESRCPVRFEELGTPAFSALELAAAIETTWLRRVFLKVAVAMVKADGTFSDGERHAVGEIADAFGLTNAEFGDIEQEASRVSLE